MREATHKTMAGIAGRAGKQLAPQLKDVIGYESIVSVVTKISG